MPSRCRRIRTPSSPASSGRSAASCRSESPARLARRSRASSRTDASRMSRRRFTSAWISSRNHGSMPPLASCTCATVEQVHEASGGIDPWFLDEIHALVNLRRDILDASVLDEALLRRAKRAGLSDRQLAALRPELAGEDGVRILRHRLGIRPVYKTVDTRP